LDRFAGVDLARLRAARVAVRDLLEELERLGGDERTRAREIDLLRYQVDEIEAAAIEGPDEDERPEAEEDQLADAAAPRAATAAARSMRPCRPATRWASRSPRWPAAGRSPRPRSGCGPWRPRSPTSPPRSAVPARRSRTTPSAWRPCASAASCCASCAAST